MVADIFFLSQTDEQVERFKENLNSQPRNIRFTSELEKDGSYRFWTC